MEDWEGVTEEEAQEEEVGKEKGGRRGQEASKGHREVDSEAEEEETAPVRGVDLEARAALEFEAEAGEDRCWRHAPPLASRPASEDMHDRLVEVGWWITSARTHRSLAEAPHRNT